MQASAEGVAATVAVVRAICDDLERDWPLVRSVLTPGARSSVLPVDTGHGFPGSTLGGAPGGGGVSDPTARVALDGPDQASLTLERAGKMLRLLLAAAQDLDRIRAFYRPMAAGRSCANANGCPANRLAASGRTRCEGCSRYLSRNGRDRTGARGRPAA